MVNGGFGEILFRFESGCPGDPMQCVVQKRFDPHTKGLELSFDPQVDYIDTDNRLWRCNKCVKSNVSITLFALISSPTHHRSEGEGSSSK